MKKINLSTDKKSGDYNPFYNGVDNNIFPRKKYTHWKSPEVCHSKMYIINDDKNDENDGYPIFSCQNCIREEKINQIIE